MKLNKLKNLIGYTLIETVISIAIGALAFSALAVGLNSGFFASQDVRFNLYATNAVREELEKIRGADFDTVVTSKFFLPNAQLAKIPGADGLRSVTGSDPDIKRITLTVSWTSASNRPLSHTVVTNLSRKGLNGLS